MTLNYALIRPPNLDSRETEGSFFIEFRRHEEVDVRGRRWPVWRAVGWADTLDPEPPNTPDSRWVRAEQHGGQLDLGIGRYYFSEARKAELNALRPGQFYVHVRLGRDGALRVEDLVFDTPADQ